MTPPLVPAEVDLRGMPWMPLDTVRLIDSDLFALSTGDEFKAAVALWCKSWTQVPAASLPQDDRILAHLSGAGARWKKLKAMALRGWALCDDGRYYHAVLAEKALEAWEQREEYQDRQDNERTRLQNFRAEHKALRSKLREHGIVLLFDTKIDVLRERVALLPETKTETPPETETFQDGNACNATAMAKTGTGTGIYQEREREARTTPEDAQLPDGVDPERWSSYRDQLADDGKLSISRIKTALMQLRRVIAAGHDPNAVLTAAVMRGLRDLDDVAVRLARERGSPPSGSGPPRVAQPQQSRQMQAVDALEQVTAHVIERNASARLAAQGAQDRHPETGLPEPGIAAVR